MRAFPDFRIDSLRGCGQIGVEVVGGGGWVGETRHPMPAGGGFCKDVGLGGVPAVNWGKWMGWYFFVCTFAVEVFAFKWSERD